MTNSFESEIEYFARIINRMQDDIPDVWVMFDCGAYQEFKKYIGINTYEIVNLPEIGSEQYRFRELMWRGTWESLVDFHEGKCKKLKFLNEIKSVKQRYLAALKFMEEHGPRAGYWSKNECPEDGYIA